MPTPTASTASRMKELDNLLYVRAYLDKVGWPATDTGAEAALWDLFINRK